MKPGLGQNNGYIKLQKLDPFELIDNNDITQLEHYIKHVDINETYIKEPFEYFTLLSYVCEKGHIEIVQLLLEQDGINVNHFAPFAAACFNGHIEIVKLLLQHPNINIIVWSPLSYFCENGYVEIVRLLLEHSNIDVNKGVPVVWACENRHIDIVRLLLERKDIIITQNKHVYNILLKLKRYDLLKVFTNLQVKEYKKIWIQKFNILK